MRANSRLTATEYAQPVLGLIFLSHASSRLHKLIQRIEQEDPTAQKMAHMVKTVPSFPQQTYETGGILVERGSTLSHSAVVARELGIPAIVGIPNITKILQDGERVRMDGALGTIVRLESHNLENNNND